MICQIKKYYGTLRLLVTHDHVRLEIQNNSSHICYLISAKVYEDVVWRGEIQAITFLGNWPKILKLNAGVNAKILKCAIS